MKKNEIEQWLGHEFESSTGLTKEFAQFAKDFKKHILSALPQGSELVMWSRGHFEVCGFVKRGNKYVYFSISDVRYWPDGWYNDILVRTAKGERDYTGGCNHTTTLPKFTEAVEKLLALPVFPPPLVNIRELISETERNCREALATIEKINPCVVWADEEDKATT